MKKPYRLAYDWLTKWHTALMQTNNPNVDFFAALSRDLAKEPDGLTGIDLKLYRDINEANFNYLEQVFIEMGKPAAKGLNNY